LLSVVSVCTLYTEGIELQPLNGQGQVDDITTPAPNWEAHDAVDVVVLDGKKKREWVDISLS